MFFRDLKMKAGAVKAVTLADVHMPVRLGHGDAEKLFAEPLKQPLAAAGLGTVMGCMRRKRANGEVIGVDLYLGLRHPSAETLKTVARMLEHLSAPLGSSIRLSDAQGTPLLFGRSEGLELSIARDAIPNAEACRKLSKICNRAIEKIGVTRGWAEQGGRTRFFFYSEDIAAMQEGLLNILSGYPEYHGASLRRLA